MTSVRAVHDRALAEAGDVPVVVLGHSMGSIVAQRYVQLHPVVGFVLSGAVAPAPELGEMVTGLRGLVDAGMGDEPLDTMSGFNESFEPSRTRYDWLSRDEAEVDTYIADPFCGDDMQMTTAFVADMLGMLADAAEPANIDQIADGTPVLLLTGDKDPVSNGGEAVRGLEKLYRDAGLDVTAHYYPDARHEVFNETNRDEVTEHLRTWLAGVLG